MAVDNSGHWHVDEIGTNYGSEEELRRHSVNLRKPNQVIEKWTGGIKTGRKIWTTHGEYVLPEIFRYIITNSTTGIQRQEFLPPA